MNDPHLPLRALPAELPAEQWTPSGSCAYVTTTGSDVRVWAVWCPVPHVETCPAEHLTPAQAVWLAARLVEAHAWLDTLTGACPCDPFAGIDARLAALLDGATPTPATAPATATGRAGEAS